MGVGDKKITISSAYGQCQVLRKIDFTASDDLTAFTNHSDPDLELFFLVSKGRTDCFTPCVV
jgi:hypothetical protein